MQESSSLRPSEAAFGHADSLHRLVAWAGERLSSREIALKVCVGSVAAVVLARLGPIAALGGVIVSLLVEDAVERLVRRLRKRTLWAIGVLAILLKWADRALAAVGLRGRRGAAPGAAATTSAVAVAIVVAGFTLPELALGHALVAHRSFTFFGARHDAGNHQVVVGPAGTLTLPREVRVEATSGSGARVPYDASANAGRLTCTPPSRSLFPIGRTTVRCEVHLRARISRGAFPVVVEDRSPPRLELPGDISWPTSAVNGAIVTYRATAVDEVEGDVTARCIPRSGTRFALGATTVECATSDRYGNGATGSFTVDVERVDGRQLVLPADMTVEATSDAGAVARYTASAGGIGVSCTPRSGSPLPIGETTVSCRAGSDAGAFRISVVDTTAPRFGVLRRVSAHATSRRGAGVTYAITARDSVDGALVPACSPKSGETFAIGETAVHCNVRDAHGNTRTASFGVAVLDGPPKLDLPAGVSAATVDARGAAVPLRYSAVDAVDGRIAASCRPAKRIFPMGRTKVTCSVKDSAGNVASASLFVVVGDEDAPRLTVPNGPVQANATGPKGGRVTWRAAAVDNVDGAVPVSCDPTSGSVFGIGDARVTCRAHDHAGNVAKKSFVVSVHDHDPPVVLVPTHPVLADADDAQGAKVTFGASADDAVDGPVSVNCDHPTGSLFALGDTRVSCTAHDSSGNVSKPAAFTVSVRDGTPPRLLLPNGPLVESAVNADGAPVRFSAAAVDNVDGSLAAECDRQSGEVFALANTLVTCTATDAAGNRATDSFVIQVLDRDGPEIRWPPNPVQATATSWSGVAVRWKISAVDNVDGRVPVTCDPVSGSVFPIGDTTVECWASDRAGNTTRGSFTVRVYDGVPR
jgi:hypothetical protein